jgi:predicted helicase
VLAFVTNRSFIDSRTFDGFRKTVADEFAEIRIVDLGGDVRANPKLSGTKHNVFGIQTGVAISFFVKKAGGGKGRCRIFYARRPEMETAEEKLAWLGTSQSRRTATDEVRPDGKANWLDVPANDYEELLPLASAEAKSLTSQGAVRTVFKLYTLGINSGRDDWMFDFAADALKAKLNFLISFYNEEQQRLGLGLRSTEIDRAVRNEIKWTAELKSLLRRGERLSLKGDQIVHSMYRPFTKQLYYFNRQLTKRVFRVPDCQPSGIEQNVYVLFPANGSTKRAPFSVLATDSIPDLNFFTPDPAHAMIRYRYDSRGGRADNITDWSLTQFTTHYKAGPGKRLPEPTKEGIFHYVYAVLHDPIYRETYAQNLKREFPRIPMYGGTRADFWRWAEWGKALMDLHIGYEQVLPAPLKRTDTPDEKARAAGQSPKCILKSLPDAGRIVIDSETVLDGVPPEAWTYRLGNRSAIDWVLDQHKEKKPKDPTIRAKFDTYRFADHKERVIDLLARVTTVSVETVKIVESIRNANR